VNTALKSCSSCGDISYFHDERVIGFWVHGDETPRKENAFRAVDEDEYGEDMLSGSSVFCLECAPCECGDHEMNAPHKAENIEQLEGVGK